MGVLDTTPGPITPVNNQTGTTYTLALSDGGKLVNVSNAGSIAVTIPANSAVPFPIGTSILIEQGGAGQITVGITTDTLRSTPGAKTRAQYSVLSLFKRTATEWVLGGDASA